jgi:energy-coupling factor transport system permease protein
MSDFEFLPSATIGQYIPTGSILHRIDPRAKLIGFGILMMAITFSVSKVGVGIGLIAVILGILISRVPLKFALKGLIPPLPFMVIIAVLQFFFYPNPGTSIIFRLGPVILSLAGILSGILIILRFFTLILAISLMSFVTSTSELIQGLQKLLSPLNRIGIHTMDLVMVFQVTLRFIPFLAQSAERIAKAQASRGAEWGGKSKGLLNRVRQIVPLIIPLFTTSLRRSETMALAMDARAYGFNANRTSMFEYTFTWRDALFLLILTAVGAAVIFI